MWSQFDKQDFSQHIQVLICHLNLMSKTSLSIFKWPAWHLADNLLHKVTQISTIFARFRKMYIHLYTTCKTYRKSSVCQRVEKWEPSFLLIRTTDQEVRRVKKYILKTFLQRFLELSARRVGESGIRWMTREWGSSTLAQGSAFSSGDPA